MVTEGSSWKADSKKGAVTFFPRYLLIFGCFTHSCLTVFTEDMSNHLGITGLRAVIKCSEVINPHKDPVPGLLLSLSAAHISSWLLLLCKSCRTCPHHLMSKLLCLPSCIFFGSVGSDIWVFAQQPWREPSSPSLTTGLLKGFG